MINLNYKRFGDQGDLVIILHGLFGMLDNWQTFAKRLASSNYQVIILDQRNHGKSTHTEEFSYDLLADDINTFCFSNEIEEAMFIGHSMGGKTVMKTALKYPHLVSKQIIVDIGPKAYEGNHNEIFKALFALDLDKLKNRSEIKEKLSSFIDSEGVIQFLMKNLERKKPKGYGFKMNLKSLFNNYENILANITEDDGVSLAPSLFIKGGNSAYLDWNDLDQIQEIFFNCSMEVIENAGHWIHAEKPNELMEVVLDFLDD